MASRFDDIDEVTLDVAVTPGKFVSRETPGRRMLNKTHLIPSMYLSKYGKNRRKANKFSDRKRALVRLTDLV